MVDLNNWQLYEHERHRILQILNNIEDCCGTGIFTWLLHVSDRFPNGLCLFETTQAQGKMFIGLVYVKKIVVMWYVFVISVKIAR